MQKKIEQEKDVKIVSAVYTFVVDIARVLQGKG